MIIILKFIHFLCFSLAIGGGVANLLLGKKAAGLEPTQAMPIRLTQAIIGKMATGSLLLLWITGLWMWIIIYKADPAINLAFQIKIAAVIVLTLINITFNVKIIKATQAGTPPDPVFARKAGLGIFAMALIAVFGAIAAFGS